jgi:hypothetical protein
LPRQHPAAPPGQRALVPAPGQARDRRARTPGSRSSARQAQPLAARRSPPGPAARPPAGGRCGRASAPHRRRDRGPAARGSVAGQHPERASGHRHDGIVAPSEEARSGGAVVNSRHDTRDHRAALEARD